jgi:heme/copper-type cytochrome/quinol oxidase subunit 2
MDSITIWTYSLIAATVVILIVAALLIAIVLTARKIDDHAKDIWQAGKLIAGNTVSIWMLKDTNVVAGDILTTAQSIAGVAGEINHKLDDLGQALTKGA